MSVLNESMLSTVAASKPAEGAPLAFKSGNTYEGALTGSTTMDGEGTYTWATADPEVSAVSYTGTFKANGIDGAGTYTWGDGSTYTGQVVGGKRHGVGTFAGPSGFPLYEGEWVAGRRHGSGKLIYAAKGDVYEGQWADDVRSGEGTLTHSSGNVYAGSWAADKKNGEGSFEWVEKREKYVGQWKNNLPHGQGEHAWMRPQQATNPFQLRERYVGSWAEGMREGHGSFYYASGATYVGEWAGNQKHGHGYFAFEDGSVYEGPFEEDRMTDGLLRATSELYTYLELGHLLTPEMVDPTTAALRHVLIRHNTALKQMYRFYAALGTTKEDAFDLTLSQFRTFAIDASLISRDLTFASLDEVVMRSSAYQPTATALPRPLVLATAVAGLPPTAGEADEVTGAMSYVRSGLHDGKRTILLREFVQGLTEIAAAQLKKMSTASLAAAAADYGSAGGPIPPLAKALLTMIEKIIADASSDIDAPIEPSALTGSPNATALRSRLMLAYSHYAATEPAPRVSKAAQEPTLTVRGYVKMLNDGGLLPAGSNISQLLAATLPDYYLPSTKPAAEPEAKPPAASLAEGAVPEGLEAAAEPAAAEEEAVVEEPAAPVGVDDALSSELVEELLELKLIYSEFEATMGRFTALYAAKEPLPPWVPPPPPPPPPEEGEEGEAAAEPEGEEGEAAAEPPAEEPAALDEIVIDVAEAIGEMVLPKIGNYLLTRLGQLAAEA